MWTWKRKSSSGKEEDKWPFIFREEAMRILGEAFQDTVAGTSRFVVIRRRETEQLTGATQDALPAVKTGKGIGKTRLMQEFQKLVQQRSPQKRLEVVALLDTGKILETGVQKLPQLFVEAFFEGHRRVNQEDMATGIRYFIARFVLVARLGLVFILLGIPLLGSISEIAAGIATPDAINRFVQMNWPVLLVLVLLVLTVNYWTYRAEPEKKIKTYLDRYPSPRFKRGQIVSRENPIETAELVLSYLKTGEVLVAIIDDVDYVDPAGYDFLNNLYDLALRKRVHILLVLTYNPDNHRLATRDMERVSRDLENEERRRKLVVPIDPLTKSQMEEIIWRRFHRYGEKTGSVVKIFHQLLPGASLKQETADSSIPPLFGRADLVLGFLDYLIEQGNILETQAGALVVKPPTELVSGFQEYVTRDRNRVGQLVERLDQEFSEVSYECKEILKYMLAFKRRFVSQSFLQKLSDLGVPTFRRCIEVLTEKLNLLGVHNSDVILDPEVRLNLSREWDDKDRRYGTKVFEFLLTKRSKHWEHIEDQALGSLPSVKAVDVLIKKGEYLAQELGYLVSALHYLDEALVKWENLVEDSFNRGSGMSDLLEWPYDTIPYDPKMRPLDSYPSKTVSPLSLCKLVGRLYFIVGRWADAETLWRFRWPNLYSKLSDLDRTAAAKQIQMLDCIVQADSAYLQYLKGNWDEALLVCHEFREKEIPAAPEAHQILALVDSFIEEDRQQGIEALRKDFGLELNLSSMIEPLQQAINIVDHCSIPYARALGEIARLYLATYRRRPTQAIDGQEDNANNSALKQSIHHLSLLRQALETLASEANWLEDGEITLLWCLYWRLRAEAIQLDPSFNIVVRCSDGESSYNLAQLVSGIEAILEWAGNMFVEGVTSSELEKTASQLAHGLEQMRSPTGDGHQPEGKQQQHFTPTLSQLAELAALLTKGLVVLCLDNAESRLKTAEAIYEFLAHRWGMALAHLERVKIHKARAHHHTLKDEEIRPAIVEALKAVLAIGESLSAKGSVVHSNFELATMYEIQEHHPQAANLYLRCAKLCEQLQFPALHIAFSYDNACRVFHNAAVAQGSDETAMEAHCLMQTHEWYKRAEDDPIVRMQYSEVLNRKLVGFGVDVAELSYNQKEPDKAWAQAEDFLRRWELNPKLANALTVGRALHVQGLAAAAQGNLLVSQAKLEAALNKFDLAGDDFGKLKALFHLVSVSRLAHSQTRQIVMGFNVIGSRVNLQTITMPVRAAFVDPRVLHKYHHYHAELCKLYEAVRKDNQLDRDSSMKLLAALVAELLAETRPDIAANVLSEALTFYCDLGEFIPAAKIIDRLSELSKEGQYDPTELEARMLEVLRILDMQHPHAQQILDRLYRINRSLTGFGDFVSRGQMEKRQLLNQGTVLYQQGKILESVDILSAGWQRIQDEEARGEDDWVPEPTDLALLQLLHDALRANQCHEEASQIQAYKNRLQSLRNATIFYRLAEYYAEIRPHVAVRLYTLAAQQRPENVYTLEAKRRKYALEESLQDVDVIVDTSQVVAQLRAWNDPRRSAKALRDEGDEQFRSREFEVAIRSYQESLRIYAELGDIEPQAFLCGQIGLAFGNLGRHDAARSYFVRYREFCQRMESKHGEAVAEVNLGWSYYQTSNPDAAREHLRRARDLQAELGQQEEANRIQGWINEIERQWE